MAKKSIKKNYIYNLFFQLFKIIVPILATPYIARTLSEDGAGNYAFSYSIVTYFVLLAALGFESYAQRLVASHQNDKHQQSIDFWEIMIAKLFPASLSAALYLVLVNSNIFDSRHYILLMILTLEIVATGFDVSFFFQGNEEFGLIVIVHAIVRVLSYACVFIFVKRQDDLWIYALIQSLSAVVSNAVLWLFLCKRIERVRINELRFLKHFPATLMLFLPTVAVSIYTTLDKTLIGLITNSDSENGNYSYAERLVKMSMTVVTSLGAVMIPRNSKQFAENDMKGIESNINNSIRFVFFLGVPIMLGLIAVADNLIPWFLGDGYHKAAGLLKILSPLVILIGLSNVFGKQFLIPSRSDRQYTISIICGAALNLVLNLILIKNFLSEGAAVATIVAEFLIAILMFIFVSRKISIVSSFAKSWKYWLSGFVMFVPCYILCQHLSPSFFHTFLIVLCGVLVYSLALIVLREEFVLKILKFVKSHIFRGKP